MSKAVMINIKPQLCQHITQGKEIIEARMTKPKLKHRLNVLFMKIKIFTEKAEVVYFKGQAKL